MSFLRWTPRANRRFYSANNASKFGGGGRLNPAKGSKSHTVTSQTKVSTTRTGSSSSLQAEGSSQTPRHSKKKSTAESSASYFGESHGPSLAGPITTTMASHPIPAHPIMSHGELMMHQLFSLHRPMLLYNQPVYRHFEYVPINTRMAETWWSKPAPIQPSSVLIEDPPEATPEADADAARVLSRQLVINRVQETLTWDATLSKMGVVHEDRIGEQTRVDMAKELEAVKSRIARNLSKRRILADSVKRKRKKKMKKHK